MDGINIFHIWHKVLGHTEKKKKIFFFANLLQKPVFYVSGF